MVIYSFFQHLKIETDILDLRKIFFDDKSHHHGHGHAYSKYDIDPKEGLVVVVRPDQRKCCVLFT